MKGDHIILGGDLKFSIDLAKSWGSRAIPNPKSAYFEQLIDEVDILDLVMPKKLPTWRNRRTREATLARRLDRFLIKANLGDKFDKAGQWVGVGGSSDHSPIYLEIQMGNHNPRTPFKFNSSWLEEPEFHSLVKNKWIHCDQRPDIEPAQVLFNNLSKLNSLTNKWARGKKKLDEETLKNIETELGNMTGPEGLRFLSFETNNKLIHLEMEKAKLLRKQEEEW